jgi:hypothetical protein
MDDAADNMKQIVDDYVVPRHTLQEASGMYEKRVLPEADGSKKGKKKVEL